MRSTHRIVALLFLLSIPLAAYASFTGDPQAPSPLVYLPLGPLAFLTLTGTVLLVRPWIQRLRKIGDAANASQ